MKKIMIGMSGGVDSSVAAYLLKKQGYDCLGATMLLHSCQSDGNGAVCGSNREAEDAKSVADRLEIPFHLLDFSDSFEKEVIRRFVDAYENGRTPNPCVDCNRYLKFEKMFRAALELGCDGVATGHYARIEFSKDSGRFLLKKALDTGKDQSYFLWSLSQEQLSHTLFPLGSMTKSETRALAEANGFVTAKKRDSQDICFVPNGKYAEFLEQFTHKTYPPGDFVSEDGTVLGTHKGIIRYTVGQKKGLGLVLPEPLYVKAVNAKTNQVTLCKPESLFSDELTADHVNLISLPRIDGELRCKARIRYRHAEQPATVMQTDSGLLTVRFDVPQRAITKGQSVVLYDGDTVIGGGLIR